MDSNITGDCYHKVSANIYVISLIILVTFILTAISVFVVVVICCTRALHTNTNIMMASLAVSNILLAAACTCIVDQSVSDRKANIPKGDISSSFVLGACFSSVSLTIMHMGAIAVDRYIRIAHPFYYMTSVSKRHVSLILISQWIGVASLITPMLAFTKHKYHERCIFLYPPYELFSLFVLLYIISFAVVCTSYMKIAMIAFRHKKAANSRRMLTDGDGVTFKRNRMAALKSVKFFALMFGVFSMFTLPPLVSTTLSYFYPVQQIVHFSLMFCYDINSVVNSCIYIYMNKEFVLALRRSISYIKLGCSQSRD